MTGRPRRAEAAACTGVCEVNARNPYLWFSVIGLIVLVIAALVIIPNLSGGAQATPTPTSSPTSVPATATEATPTNAPQNTSTALPSATATRRVTLTSRSTATSATTPTATKRATQAVAPTQTAQPQATAQPSSTPIPPTARPTEQPTDPPTQAPTATTAPTVTSVPTLPPTTQPTEAPTEAPTQSPTESPTESPTTLAAGFVSAPASGGTGEREAGLEAAEAEFVSTAQSSNATGEPESEADWMAQLWRWTGPVVVALLISVGVLLWLAELAVARRWPLASVITRLTAKPSPQPSPDESR